MPGQFESILDKLQAKLGKQTIKRASTINRPRPKFEVQQIDIFNKFNRRNPKADGGSVNGSEQAALRKKVEELMDDGYDFGEAVREAMRQGYQDGGRIGFKDGTPVKFDNTRVKIPTGEFVGEGRDKSQIFKIKNNKSGSVKYTTSGAGGGKKKLYNSIEEVKKAKLDFLPDEFVKTNSKRIKENIQEVTYKNKKTGKIITKYKPFIGPDKVTIPGQGADTLKEAEKFVKKYFKENPKKIRVRDPKKDYESKDVRKKVLKETDPTKAKGTKKFNYHHVRQIAGGVPLTTDDVMIINQRINSALGTKYNKPLNSIAAAIQKNNKLALEAMNAKQEGLALDYMKRVDDLNDQAEKIVNSAIDDLPKKYKGYVGFNQFELPRDEYGLPISNEPMRIKKVGGMPVSKNAVDLTMLNLKEEKKFKQIVNAQAKAGKVGPINKILKNAGKVLSGASKVAKPLSLVVGPYAVMSAAAKADDMDIKLGLGDQAAAFLMGDPQAAIDMYRMRNDPEYAQQVRAANYARPLDEGTYDAIDESFTSYFDGGIVSVLKGVK